MQEVEFLESGLCAIQFCIRSGVVSWMPFNPSSSNVPSCSCSLIRFPLVLPYTGWRGFLVVVPGRWTARRTSNPKAQVLFFDGLSHCMGWGSWIQGAGLVREILNYIFIKKTVWWWGRIWFILWFWLLLSTLSAVCSVSLHSEAARADQNWCHKRQRLLKQT